MVFLQRGREYLEYGMELRPSAGHNLPALQAFGNEQKGTITGQLILNPLYFSSLINKKCIT